MNNDIIMNHDLGGNERPTDERDFPLGAVQAPADHPPVFMQNISPITIYNQNKTPSCGAHAGTWFKSYEKFIELGQPLNTQQFSPASLWIEIKSDGTSPDAGTDMRTIFKNLQTKGVCDITLWANNTLLSNVAYAAGPLSDAARKNALVNVIRSYAFLPSGFSFDDLKKAIYQNGAVLLLMKVNAQMWTAPSGVSSWAEHDILPMRPPTNQYPVQSGHFVVAHSYDENYIYFANSWSLQWGRNGHGYFGINYMPQLVEAGLALDLPLDLVNQLKQTGTPKYKATDKIMVTKQVNVRGNATTSGKILGEQDAGMPGTIVSGPIVNNGYIWWNINFIAGASGWCIENNIAAVVNSTASPVPTLPTPVIVTPATPVGEGWFGRLLTLLGLNH